MFDCEMTVKGNGIGNYGRNKNDRTGPVKEFMVDNQFFYTRVFQHIKKCDKCDAADALRWYLARRKGKGISVSLAALALKYDRHFQIPRGLRNEFLFRGHDLARYSIHLTTDELYNAIVYNYPNISWQRQQDPKVTKRMKEFHLKMLELASEFATSGADFPYGDFQDLVATMEVIHA